MNKDSLLRLALNTSNTYRRGTYVTLLDRATAIEILRVSEGWTWAEVAYTFKVSITTVRAWYARAYAVRGGMPNKVYSPR